MFARIDSPHLLTGIGYDPNTHLGRIQHVIEYSLNEKKILLTSGDVKQFYCAETRDWFKTEPSLVDVFTVMVSTGKVSPSWNPRLTRLCLFTFARMYSWELRDMLPSLETRVAPFLQSPDVMPHEIVQLLLVFHRMILHARHEGKVGREQIPDEMNSLLIHECLKYPTILFTTLLSDEEWVNVLNSNLPRDGFLIKYAPSVKKTLLPILSSHREIAKKIIREKLELIKESLMAAAWHPSRVSLWLEKGGFEFLENIM